MFRGKRTCPEADDYLGRLCAQLTLALFPQRIVLGGGVMQQPRLFPLVRACAQHWLAGHIARTEIETDIDTDIVPPALGEDSGIVGALLVASAAE